MPDFGTQTLSSQIQDYTLNSGTNHTLTVTDNRGTGAGWEVTVQADKLHTASGKMLDGGNIIIDQTQNINGNGSVATAPDVAESITADTFDINGNPVPAEIVGAKADNHQGMGTWDINWADSNIHLKINPGEAYSGQAYTATITWTLNDTPLQ
ncbi:WxL domain-containing protein [Terrilactibacillus sp. S3-3]|nr:WxL domain-containing protein [Terrilactibacillus sp. S3-3]